MGEDRPDVPVSDSVDTSGAAEAFASAAPVPSMPERDQSGRFRSGNMAAVKHALRTDRLPKEFAQLAQEVEDFMSASITDDGGDSEVPARRRSLHEYRARLHRRVLQIDGAIELLGLFDKRGKLRVAWLQQLQGLISAAKGIDTLLGLDRRQKPTLGLKDVLRGHEDIDG